MPNQLNARFYWKFCSFYRLIASYRAVEPALEYPGDQSNGCSSMLVRSERNPMRLPGLFLLAFVVWSSLHSSLAAADTKGPDIAVMRLDEVIRNSKVYLARVDQLKADQAAAQAQLGQMEEQRKAVENKLQVLSPASEKFGEAQEELEVLKVKSELLAKRVRAQLDRRHGAALKEAFDVARGHLKDFAKERGIRLVTLAPNPQMPALSSNDMQMQLGLQTSLYFDDNLDITEAFIAFMNSRYEGAAPNAGPAPATNTPPKPAGP